MHDLMMAAISVASMRERVRFEEIAGRGRGVVLNSDAENAGAVRSWGQIQISSGLGTYHHVPSS